VQVLSLGAGYDTLAFWLNQQNKKCVFFEVDFPDVTTKKLSVIRRENKLIEQIASNEEEV